MRTSEESSSSILKNRFGTWLKRLIPGSSFFYGGKSLEEGHGAHEEHEEHADADALIREVCEKELQTS